MSNYQNRRILNVSQAAEYSGYSRGWVEYWIGEGLLPYESPPGQGEGKQHRKFIRKEDLDLFLKAHYCNNNRTQKVEKMDRNYHGVTLLPPT